jgi:hypothetical protein
MNKIVVVQKSSEYEPKEKKNLHWIAESTRSAKLSKTRPIWQCCGCAFEMSCRNPYDRKDQSDILILKPAHVAKKNQTQTHILFLSFFGRVIIIRVHSGMQHLGLRTQ